MPACIIRGLKALIRGDNTFIPMGEFRRLFHQPWETYRTPVGRERGVPEYDCLAVPQYDLEDVPDDSFPQTYFRWDGRHADEDVGTHGVPWPYFHAERLPSHPQDSHPASRFSRDGLGKRSTLMAIDIVEERGRDSMARVQREIDMFQRAQREGRKHFARLRGAYHYRKRTFMEYEDMRGWRTLDSQLGEGAGRVMSERDASRWARQLIETHKELRGMRYYHGQGNRREYLVDKEGTIKLADVGTGAFARYRNDGTVNVFRQRVTNNKATPPEVVVSSRYNTSFDPEKASVFCIGHLVGNFLSAKTSPRPLSPGAIDFVRHATAADPSQRPTLDELMVHSCLASSSSAAPTPSLAMTESKSFEVHPPDGRPFVLLFPVERGRRPDAEALLQHLQRDGRVLRSVEHPVKSSSHHQAVRPLRNVGMPTQSVPRAAPPVAAGNQGGQDLVGTHDRGDPGESVICDVDAPQYRTLNGLRRDEEKHLPLGGYEEKSKSHFCRVIAKQWLPTFYIPRLLSIHLAASLCRSPARPPAAAAGPSVSAFIDHSLMALAAPLPSTAAPERPKPPTAPPPASATDTQPAPQNWSPPTYAAPSRQEAPRDEECCSPPAPFTSPSPISCTCSTAPAPAAEATSLQIATRIMSFQKPLEPPLHRGIHKAPPPVAPLPYTATPAAPEAFAAPPPLPQPANTTTERPAPPAPQDCYEKTIERLRESQQQKQAELQALKQQMEQERQQLMREDMERQQKAIEEAREAAEQQKQAELQALKQQMEQERQQLMRDDMERQKKPIEEAREAAEQQKQAELQALKQQMEQERQQLMREDMERQQKAIEEAREAAEQQKQAELQALKQQMEQERQQLMREDMERQKKAIEEARDQERRAAEEAREQERRESEEAREQERRAVLVERQQEKEGLIAKLESQKRMALADLAEREKEQQMFQQEEQRLQHANEGLSCELTRQIDDLKARLALHEDWERARKDRMRDKEIQTAAEEQQQPQEQPPSTSPWAIVGEGEGEGVRDRDSRDDATTPTIKAAEDLPTQPHPPTPAAAEGKERAEEGHSQQQEQDSPEASTAMPAASASDVSPSSPVAAPAPSPTAPPSVPTGPTISCSSIRLADVGGVASGRWPHLRKMCAIPTHTDGTDVPEAASCCRIPVIRKQVKRDKRWLFQDRYGMVVHNIMTHLAISRLAQPPSPCDPPTTTAAEQQQHALAGVMAEPTADFFRELNETTAAIEVCEADEVLPPDHALILTVPLFPPGPPTSCYSVLPLLDQRKPLLMQQHNLHTEEEWAAWRAEKANKSGLDFGETGDVCRALQVVGVEGVEQEAARVVMIKDMFDKFMMMRETVVPVVDDEYRSALCNATAEEDILAAGMERARGDSSGAPFLNAGGTGRFVLPGVVFIDPSGTSRGTISALPGKTSYETLENKLLAELPKKLPEGVDWGDVAGSLLEYGWADEEEGVDSGEDFWSATKSAMEALHPPGVYVSKSLPPLPEIDVDKTAYLYARSWEPKNRPQQQKKDLQRMKKLGKAAEYERIYKEELSKAKWPDTLLLCAKGIDSQAACHAKADEILQSLRDRHVQSSLVDLVEGWRKEGAAEVETWVGMVNEKLISLLQAARAIIYCHTSARADERGEEVRAQRVSHQLGELLPGLLPTFYIPRVLYAHFNVQVEGVQVETVVKMVNERMISLLEAATATIFVQTSVRPKERGEGGRMPLISDQSQLLIECDAVPFILPH
ncbi:unnamed protein product [Vitrella brassicaformis CCMP3155]|uniref:Protein kinase domain-containing protein n=1 Tax=Vitrella brassicaformis (strain CCMP3155) TaxID=1169540 RepID=A0A0G4GIB9_VITBC|nr:unnamed protein product [Vitrella brassicaformis CCMP3155]|eukprot:CEM29592.1 unnamed protein product [Vitrella brassicaformis CCMP3155]